MYTKHDWQDGELITKTLMNNMEAYKHTGAYRTVLCSQHDGAF